MWSSSSVVFWYTGLSKWMVLVFLSRQCLHTSTAPNATRAVTTAGKDEPEKEPGNASMVEEERGSEKVELTHWQHNVESERVGGRRFPGHSCQFVSWEAEDETRVLLSYSADGVCTLSRS